MTSARQLPDPQVEPTISVERAAILLGVGRGTAYRAAQTGEIPAVRVGARYVIPTGQFLAKFGLSQTPTAA
ncbi:excisionase family DNA-binding protein [Micromonospora tulbaghiae]|uniref:excisionase family DNA-binding protein n=1 Tax=Micromonospora TaxID=1873 RepID=UPI000828A88C|nr:excisionase family DNA-binding protein [Micromonospora aurantiaca]SCL40049.1 DNA binding domain-containing protein, excisionase family [Micromonospora aurantiaca]